jgi:VanZ family protein
VISLRLWAPPALLAGTIYLLSSFSHVPVVEYGWDKAAHAAIFGALALLTLRATHGGMRPLALAPAAAAVLLVVGWGTVDELHQAFVPGRDPSALDVVADAVGTGLALAIWGLWQGTARIPRAEGEGGGEA